MHAIYTRSVYHDGMNTTLPERTVAFLGHVVDKEICSRCRYHIVCMVHTSWYD